MSKLIGAIAWFGFACASPPPPGPTTPTPTPAPPEVEPVEKQSAVTGSCTAEEGGDESFGAMTNERIGGLQTTSTETDVVDKLGEPASEEGPEPNEVEGGFDWVWKYPDKGLTLRMSAETRDGGKQITAMTVTGKSALATRFGVTIGSSRADVERAYGPCEYSEAGGPDSFIAGTVYGGVFFNFGEDGKVETIFVGAGAE